MGGRNSLLFFQEHAAGRKAEAGAAGEFLVDVAARFLASEQFLIGKDFYAPK